VADARCASFRPYLTTFYLKKVAQKSRNQMSKVAQRRKRWRTMPYGSVCEITLPAASTNLRNRRALSHFGKIDHSLNALRIFDLGIRRSHRSKGPEDYRQFDALALGSA
jgi:hypothetical protein